ncbi:MAG: hypothetical protein H6681_00120 [Desulfobacteraceae bacterium]|nr:hypothetical protein [Desulfobacteraceae bacterium]
MSDQIYSINELLAKTANLAKTKKTENISGDSFSKILENAVTKPENLKTAPGTEKVSDVFPTPFINPLERIELNQDSARFVESSLDQILSDLEIFSNLIGNSSVDVEDIKPLVNKIQENSKEVLRYSEKNNIPDELKSIAKESTALAYAAFEIFGAL